MLLAGTAATAIAACGGSTSSAAAPSDAGTLSDGEVLDGGSPVEAGPGGNGAVMTCGAVSCPTTGAICCAYPPTNGADAGFDYLCVGGATCPVGKADDAGGTQTPTVLACTTGANCAAGTICCVAPNQNNQGAQSHTSTCKASCANGEAQLCDLNARTAECPASAPCSAANIASWELPSTFATCGGVRAQ